MDDFETNHKRWMQMLPKYVRRNIPIIYLAIPGTNNSTSYGLRPDRPTTGSAGWMPRYFNYLSPKFTLKWFKTQHSSTSEQLRNGIRYFDLKVCKTKCSKPSTSFFFANTFTSISIFEPLLAMYRFLKKNRKEVILLDFREFCDMSECDHELLQKFIYKSLGYFLLTPDDSCLEELTLYKAEKLKKSVIVIYRHKTRISEFWPGNSWHISSPETVDIKKLPNIVMNLLQERESDRGHVVRFVIRPTMIFIAENISRSMSEVAAEVHRAFSKWIVNQAPGRNSEHPKINVITIDFYDLNKNDYCNKVIGLNFLFTKITRKKIIEFEEEVDLETNKGVTCSEELNEISD